MESVETYNGNKSIACNHFTQTVYCKYTSVILMREIRRKKVPNLQYPSASNTNNSGWINIRKLSRGKKLEGKPAADELVYIDVLWISCAINQRDFAGKHRWNTGGTRLVENWIENELVDMRQPPTDVVSIGPRHTVLGTGSWNLFVRFPFYSDRGSLVGPLDIIWIRQLFI